eukprot:c51974_g1_i1 orf=121-330(+)
MTFLPYSKVSSPPKILIGNHTTLPPSNCSASTCKAHMHLPFNLHLGLPFFSDFLAYFSLYSPFVCSSSL